MKRSTFLWGMLVLLLGFIMTFVECKNEQEQEEEKKEEQKASPSFPSSKGKLTINGLSSFNDKYVYVQGLVDSRVLIGLTDVTGYPSDIAYKLVKISDGKAEVPLYTLNASASSYSDSYVAYSGNDTITSINIIIISNSSLKESNASNAITNNLGRKMITSGTFSNGNMTVNWGTIAGTWTPSGVNPTQLAENQWTSGSISTSGGEQWFTFTATASTQYIHVTFGTLSDLNVQVYDSNGDTVGNYANLYDYAKYAYWSVTSGQTYYIKVWSYSSNGSGNYQIAFTTSSSTPSSGNGSWAPSGSPIQLTVNQWTSGSISTSGGEQWFTFIATASTQYIHVTFGTLSDLNVQVYDSNGNTVESYTNLYGSTKYTSRSVTSGQTYYIKVYPYSSSGSGNYLIAFTTSSSTPNGNESNNANSFIGKWTHGGYTMEFYNDNTGTTFYNGSIFFKFDYSITNVNSAHLQYSPGYYTGSPSMGDASTATINNGVLSWNTWSWTRVK